MYIIVISIWGVTKGSFDYGLSLEGALKCSDNKSKKESSKFRSTFYEIPDPKGEEIFWSMANFLVEIFVLYFKYGTSVEP